MNDHKVEDAVVIEKKGDVMQNLQAFAKKYSKNFGVGFVVGVLAFGGYLAYNQYVVKPKEEKAADAIYKAQEFFAADSSKLVLDGNGTSKGVLYIIKNFSGTKAANLAHFYAGVSYLKLGEFSKAIEHLKDFNTDAKQVQVAAYGALADAYAESGKKSEAVDYYTKAGKTFEQDELSSSEYLFRAALLNETLGKNKEALELYRSIKEKYSKTEKGTQIDKYIARLSADKADLGIN